MNGWIAVKVSIYFSDEEKPMFYIAPILYILLSIGISYIVYSYHPKQFNNFMIFMVISLFGAIISPIISGD